MTQQTTDDRLVTPGEACTILGIARTKLYELMNTGQIPSIKLPPGTNNAGRRIEMSAIRAFINANRVAS